MFALSSPACSLGGGLSWRARLAAEAEAVLAGWACQPLLYGGGGRICHCRGLRLGWALQGSGQKEGAPRDSRGRRNRDGILVTKRDCRKHGILWVCSVNPLPVSPAVSSEKALPCREAFWGPVCASPLASCVVHLEAAQPL